MTRFPWLDKLTELSAQCAPDNWTFHSSGDNHGANVWRYHRYDEASNTDLYVELAVMTQRLSNDAHVEISVGAQVRQSEPRTFMAEVDRGTKRPLLHSAAQPEFLPQLAEILQQAYVEVERLI
jgi:hypothetical protein